MSSTLLAATEVVVRYGDQVVLDNATLGISQGDRIGLVGRNGCGKTTFLKILAGLQSPDGGTVSRRRDLVVSYLPQDFTLDAAGDVRENIRAGAQPVLDLIAEFEALPADSRRHAELEERILQLEGWTLDHRIEMAMVHLNCPEGNRRIETLSGGEKRRVAVCRAIISRPDFLMLDEPTNHLDPEAIEWVAEFLENFGGTFLVVTHDRYFLDRVARRLVELAGGRFFRTRAITPITCWPRRSGKRRTRPSNTSARFSSSANWPGCGWERARNAASRRTGSSAITTRRPGRAEYRGGGGALHPTAAAAGQPRRGTDQSGHGIGRARFVSRVRFYF